MIRVAAGIDIGGTNTVFGLVDEKGKILAKDKVSTQDFRTPKGFVNAVSKKINLLFRDYSERVKNSRLIGLGIGAPTGNFFRGTIEHAPNMPWKGIIPIADYFKDKLKIKTLLTNDANAAALGEMIFGGAKKMNDFIFITLGTGVGSGIVSNGKLVYGHDGFAGEIGHVIVERNGRLCGCGRRGCLEAYCSAGGFVVTFEGKQAAGIKKQESGNTRVSAKEIYELARKGNKKAKDAFNYTGEILGFALANSVAYSSPEAIFLFGGLAQARDLIFNPVKKSFEKNLLNIYKNKIKILPSQLKENNAAILGASSLIFKEEK